VSPEEFREIQTDLGWNHPHTAGALGMSEVSVKRMATGAQTITKQTARMLIGLLVVEQAGLSKKYQKLLDKYHSDTTTD